MTAVGGQLWVPYCGTAPDPHGWLARWNFDPWLLLGLAAGFLLLRRQCVSRRHAHLATGAFAIALLLFVSPFCALTSALFSARVAHHVLLTAAVAPLIAFAVPAERMRLPGSLTLWTAAHALVFWSWHAPPAYASALSSNSVYWLMQLTLVGSAIGFWAALRRSGAATAVAALLATMVLMGLLGALITFAGSPLYAPHLGVTEAWGLSQLQDQQLAGLIMWAPAAGIYLAAALYLANRQLTLQASRTAA